MNKNNAQLSDIITNLLVKTHYWKCYKEETKERPAELYCFIS